MPRSAYEPPRLAWLLPFSSDVLMDSGEPGNPFEGQEIELPPVSIDDLKKQL